MSIHVGKSLLIHAQVPEHLKTSAVTLIVKNLWEYARSGASVQKLTASATFSSFTKSVR